MKRLFVLFFVVLTLILPACGSENNYNMIPNGNVPTKPTLHTAKFTLYINNRYENEPGYTSSDLTAAQSLIDTCAAIIKSRNVLEAVIEETGCTLSVEEVRSMLSFSNVNDTEIMEIGVTGEDPDLAMSIAQAMCEVVPQHIQDIVSGVSVSIIDLPYLEAPTTPTEENLHDFIQ